MAGRRSETNGGMVMVEIGRDGRYLLYVCHTKVVLNFIIHFISHNVSSLSFTIVAIPV